MNNFTIKRRGKVARVLRAPVFFHNHYVIARRYTCPWNAARVAAAMTLSIISA